MPTISLTLPVAGNLVTAGLHATNYTSIQGVINGGLDTANWASGKIFAPSKFVQEGATKYQAPLWDGSQFTPSNVLVPYARLGSSVDVNTTVAETTLFSGTITGNELGTNRRLCFAGSGDYLHNNVAGDTVTIRVKYGSATLTLGPSNLGNVINATRRPWQFNLGPSFLANQQATNVQDFCAAILAPDAAGAAPFAVAIQDFQTAAIDSTANQTFAVTAQWSASSANNSWRIREFVLYLV